MFDHVLAQPTQSLLERLSRAGTVRSFYLGGGSGLALQFGHRVSQDLDWFTQAQFDPASLAAELAGIGAIQVTEEKPGTLVAVVEGVEVGFYGYAFPLLFPPVSHCGCDVASWKDILCMKLVAIGQRAAKRDYVDLFFGIQKGLRLRDLLDLTKRKYPSVNYSEYHLVRSLVYFDEVEPEPMPTMIVETDWEQIRTTLLEAVEELGCP